MIDKKSEKLNSIINDLGSFALAFSGGVDSTFLLHRAFNLRKNDIIAVTIRTSYIPAQEISDAVEFTSRKGIPHSIITIDFPETIRKNPLDRCYQCKKMLFGELKSFAERNNLTSVVDGSNADDTDDFRPGLKALNELGIRSPLMEAGLKKNEIRELCRKEGLSVWDKPAMACLLTRIPYDTEISPEALRMIEAGENLLFEKGFPGTRVRIHGDLARIECMPGYLERFVVKPVREEIIYGLKKIGFRYVSLDLEGYRTGSSNPE